MEYFVLEGEEIISSIEEEPLIIFTYEVHQCDKSKTALTFQTDKSLSIWLKAKKKKLVLQSKIEFS